jgi:aldehyde dehydrogenase (NAD+)
MSIIPNYIAGAWTEGVASIANINPSDLADVIGHNAQADRAAISASRTSASTASLRTM